MFHPSLSFSCLALIRRQLMKPYRSLMKNTAKHTVTETYDLSSAEASA